MVSCVQLNIWLNKLHLVDVFIAKVYNNQAQRLMASQVWAALIPKSTKSCGVCAQRLTASQVWAEAPSALSSFTALCSTPYGITGLGRELGTDTFYGSLRAQRLTASQVWAERQDWTGEAGQGSAQRLTASQVWAVNSYA